MSNSLFNRPVLSLRTGGSIGIAKNPVIDPHNLDILGWWCDSPNFSGHSILLTEDVREIMPNGLAVNDESTLSMPSELVRHKEILELKFELIGKQVKTKKQKLGRVTDFSYEDASMSVQKLYVTRSLTKIFTNDDTLIIDRSQIIEVTDSYILVEEPTVTETAEAPAAETAPVV